MLEAIPHEPNLGGWRFADLAEWFAYVVIGLYLLWRAARRLVRSFRPVRALSRARFLSPSRLLGLLGLFVAAGAVLVPEFIAEPKRLYWLVALAIVFLIAGFAQLWEDYREQSAPPIDSTEAPRIFEAETRGGFQMSRLHEGTLSPSNPWLLRMPDMRVTNQQNNAKLSIDLQVRLPDGATWNNMPIRSVRAVEEVPQHLRPAKPLVAPFGVEPGDTVEGDALFILPNSVRLDQLMASRAPTPGSRLLASTSYTPPGGVSDLGVEEFHPILRVIDYVSNYYAELEVSERAPALARHEARE